MRALHSMMAALSVCLPIAFLDADGSTRRGEVLDHAREAAGRVAWAALERDLRFEGQALVRGVQSEFVLSFSESGEFWFETEGQLASISTWDGETTWSREASGPARALALEEEAAMLFSQWAHSGFWCDARAPLAIGVASEERGTVTLDLTLASSSARAKLVLDAESWLPRELRQSSVGFETVLRFGDYREVGGVPIAHEVRFSGGTLEGFLRIERSDAVEARASERYRLSAERAADTSFDAARSPVVELRRVDSGHLLVQPTIEGRSDGWFILDTGAGQFCIDPVFADELELPEFGQVPAVGVAGRVMASYRQGAHFALGPLEIRDPVYVELDLSFLEQYFGVPVAGICGYDLFMRCVVELDLDGPTLSIHDPQSFELEQERWFAMSLESRRPTVLCRFEGERSGLFRIDTGDSGAVTFDAHTVRELGLLEGRELGTVQLGGVGGSARARSGRLEWFELGGHRFEGLKATFAIHDDGSKPGAATIGVLGCEVFRPFRIYFDYPSQRLGLVPRSERER